MRKLLWMGCLSYLLIGIAHVVLGSVLEELVGHYGRTYADGGQLIFNQFAGFLVGVLATPLIMRRFGGRTTLLFALGCLTAGELVYSFLPAWGWMLTAAPAAGCGFGMIEAVIGAMIIGYVKERKAVAMSRLEVFFGVGALAMPALSSVLILRGTWSAAFPIIAAASVVTALLWGRLSFGSLDKLLAKPAAKETASAIRLDRRSVALLAMMTVFFLLYVGLEMSIVNFLPTLMIDAAGAAPAAATSSITAFWITMSLGRLFAGVIAERFGYMRYLLVSCCGTLALLCVFAFVFQVWSGFAVVLALGLSMSGIFAISLVFANTLIAGPAERTTSILVAAGGIGGALVPRLVGWTIDAYAVGVTQWILAGVMLLMLLLMIAATLSRRAHPRPRPAAIQLQK